MCVTSLLFSLPAQGARRIFYFLYGFIAESDAAGVFSLAAVAFFFSYIAFSVSHGWRHEGGGLIN